MSEPGRPGRQIRACAGITILVILAGALATSLDAQKRKTARPAVVPTAFVLGRVVDTVTSRPIADATVTLAPAPDAGGPATGQPQVLADGDGRFLFRGLAAGRYVFTASAPGYLDGAHGQRAPGGPARPFALADGQRVGDLTVSLWPEGRIGGVVRDASGAPVVDANVQLLRRDGLGASARFTAGQFDASRFARTDDRGEYHFRGIPPGDYVVVVPTRTTQAPAGLGDAGNDALDTLRASGSSALGGGLRGLSPAVQVGGVFVQATAGGATSLPLMVTSSGGLMGYPTTFHPAAFAITDAAVIDVGVGEIRAGVDVTMRPAPLGAMAGQVIGPDGPAGHFAVHLIPAYAADLDIERLHEAAVAPADADGRFRMVAVPDGDYLVRGWRMDHAIAMGRDASLLDATLWGETRVTVADGASEPLILNLRRGAKLTGRLEFVGAGVPPRPVVAGRAVSAAFEPTWRMAVGNLIGVQVTDDVAFATQGLPPGAYFASLPNRFSDGLSGWHFESATRQGRDLTIEPLTLDLTDLGDIVIRFADRPTVLTGTVRLRTGEGDDAAAVVVFPADYRAWIAAGLSPLASWEAPAAADGSFALPVRPGDYLVAAIDAARLDGWRRDEVIEALAALATRVTLASGDAPPVTLQTATAGGR